MGLLRRTVLAGLLAASLLAAAAGATRALVEEDDVLGAIPGRPAGGLPPAHLSPIATYPPRP